MPKKRRKRLTPEHKERRKRAEKAAIRRIAKEEKITQKEARRYYKDALVEVFFTRPSKYAARRFIEIMPGKFREIPKGQAMRQVNAVGPIRTSNYVSMVQKMKQYWELVHILSDEYKISLKAARKQIKRRKQKGYTITKMIWEETGLSE